MGVSPGHLQVGDELDDPARPFVLRDLQGIDEARRGRKGRTVGYGSIPMKIPFWVGYENIHFKPAKFWGEQKRGTIGFDTLPCESWYFWMPHCKNCGYPLSQIMPLWAWLKCLEFHAFAISLWKMDFWQIPNVGAPNFFWCQVCFSSTHSVPAVANLSSSVIIREPPIRFFTKWASPYRHNRPFKNRSSIFNPTCPLVKYGKVTWRCSYWVPMLNHLSWGL